MEPGRLNEVEERLFALRAAARKHHVDVDELQSTISDFKSRLIEWCQKHKKTIAFDTREEENRGPEKLYSARVLIADKAMGQGKGLSKKKAEQNASEKAWYAVGAGKEAETA